MPNTFYLLLLVLCSDASLFAQTKSIILGRPTDKAITISAYFDQNVEFYLEYGTKTGEYAAKTANILNKAKTPNHVEIQGLTPNTKYFYKLRWRLFTAGTFSATPEYTFQTQRATNTTFKFAVEGDEHLHDKKGVPNLFRITLQNMLKAEPDFMVSMGDMFGDDHTPNTATSADMDFYHRDLLQYLTEACH